MHGSNIGTVTNAEGEFALKIKKTEVPRELEISHIGYVNSHISLKKEMPSKLTVWLIPHANLLNEVVVFSRIDRLLEVPPYPLQRIWRLFLLWPASLSLSPVNKSKMRLSVFNFPALLRSN